MKQSPKRTVTNQLKCDRKSAGFWTKPAGAFLLSTFAAIHWSFSYIAIGKNVQNVKFKQSS